MQNIAIYDLDRTLTRIGTYTPFLLFAMRRRPWRYALLPAYALAMVAYAAGLIERKRLKETGFRVALGKRVPAARLEALGRRYAARVCARNLHGGVAEQAARDKAAGSMLVIATAAPEFYAREIGRLLGFDEVIATRHVRAASGDYTCRLHDENCYGAAKLRRIQQWLPQERRGGEIAFYSDHYSDQPVFDWCDTPVATNPSPKLRTLAERRGWRILTAA